MDIVAEIGLSVALIACLLATFWDVRSRRIPNFTCVAVLLGGSVWALLSRHSGSSLISIGIAAAILFIGVWLHQAKVWGGGDVKFLASIVIWLPLDMLTQFILWGAIGSFITALIVRAMAWRSGGPTTVPMAVAFLCGVVAVFPHLLDRISP